MLPGTSGAVLTGRYQSIRSTVKEKASKDCFRSEGETSIQGKGGVR